MSDAAPISPRWPCPVCGYPQLDPELIDAYDKLLTAVNRKLHNIPPPRPFRYSDVFNLETLCAFWTSRRTEAPDDPLWQEAMTSNIEWATSLAARIESRLPPLVPDGPPDASTAILPPDLTRKDPEHPK